MKAVIIELLSEPDGDLGGKASLKWIEGLHPAIEIPSSEFELKFIRSSGPGGQNVNKVNSKVQLRWNLGATQSISTELRDRLLLKLANQLTTKNEVLVQSDRYRDQKKNLDDCIQKFKLLIIGALKVSKRRIKTKVSKTQQRKRVERKRVKSETKRSRSKVRY